MNVLPKEVNTFGILSKIHFGTRFKSITRKFLISLVGVHKMKQMVFANKYSESNE